MYAKKSTIADTSYEEALNELRAVVPSLHAIAHRRRRGARGRDLYHLVALFPLR
jgi:hypothetical protein